MANTYLEIGEMRIVVSLDGGDLLDGSVPGYDTNVGEVGRIEFGQCLLVESHLKILEGHSEI
jgi:hypothetical protein